MDPPRLAFPPRPFDKLSVGRIITGRIKLGLMPSLMRFLAVLGVLAGLVWGGMAALVAFVEPQPREMSQTVPPNRLNR